MLIRNYAFGIAFQHFGYRFALFQFFYIKDEKTPTETPRLIAIKLQ
jgi:hypothetical protein